MKILLIPILLSSSILSDTYIKDSVIIDSVIGNNLVSSEQKKSSFESKTIFLNKKFMKIIVNIPANISIENSSESKINLKMDKDYIEKLSFKVHDDTLYIDRIASINTRLPIDIVLYHNEFNQLNVKSASKVKVKDFNLAKLELFVSGTSKVIFLSGSINNLLLDSQGTSKINLENVVIKNAIIKSKGTSKIKLNIDGSLNVNLSGIVRVKYKGNPKIQKRIFGLAKLIKIK